MKAAFCDVAKILNGKHFPQIVVDDKLYSIWKEIWKEIWSDMYINSTFMRYDYEPGNIVGITLKPVTTKRWTLSIHICR